jgi:hypothetical protein
VPFFLKQEVVFAQGAEYLSGDHAREADHNCSFIPKGGNMHSRLNVKLWLYGSVAVFVVLSILSFLGARLIMDPLYPDLASPGTPPGDAMLLRLWNYLGRAIFSLMFAYIYTRGYEGKAALGEGLRYGLWIGILMMVPGVFTGLVSTTFSLGFLFMRSLVGLVQLLLCGILVASVYRPIGKQSAA